ncbi:MAG: PASTA domain-containing protein [Propionibacteriaceae bacterium]|nr:PASTA domain-containing protein [Propionibacteriaceae bacterium]
MPRVRGLTTAEAKKRLNNAGFKIKESNLTNYPLGFINGSNPGAGKKAPRGSTITLYIV